MQAQIVRPSFRSLAALAVAFLAIAALTLTLLVTQRPALSTGERRSAPAAPAAPAVVQAPSTSDHNPDASLPQCRRAGGPTC